MTKPMGVRSSQIGMLLDLMGRDCGPLQYLRELTKNSMEAIRRVPGGQGEIIWDYDEDDDGVRKLCITDNGDGMDSEDLQLHINSLASTHESQRHALDGNFGVGAKISAVTRNHAGLVYVSRRKAHNFTITMWKDPQTGVYGMKDFQTDDGEVFHVGSLEDEDMPEQIRTADHGTRVILLGMTDGEDTFAGHGGKGVWVRKYLNTRFFSIPDGITLKARDNDKGNTGCRTVHGQGPVLNATAKAKGVVKLSTAKAHWWIVPTEEEPINVVLGSRTITKMGSFTTNNTIGHVACLFQNELYGKGGYPLLQQFGIIFGYKQVIIYVEPTAGDVSSDTSRSRVIIDGEEPPWAEWASEFRDNMPQELKDFIEHAGGQRDSKQEEAVRDRISSVMDLFPIPKFQRDKNGKETGTPNQYRRSPPGNTSGTKKRHRNGNGNGGRHNAFGTIKPVGVLGRVVNITDVPEVVWQRVSDGTREPPYLDGRAAHFLPNTPPVIIANGDFGPFVAMVERFAAAYPDIPAAREVCRTIVEGWFGQVLLEVVIGASHLRSGSEPWTGPAIEAALSEEALTMAVMPRYLVHEKIKRDIHAKLGRPA